VVLERSLAYVGRRVAYRRGCGVFARLRKRAAQFYRGRADSWTVISDFDGDLKMRLDRGAYLGSLIYWHGGQNGNEDAVLDRVLKRDSVVFDVGANQGSVTLVAAKRVPNGRVFSFEPVPQVFAQLKANVEVNGFRNVSLFNCALSDAPGTANMYTSLDVAIHSAVNEGLASFFSSDYRTSLLGVVEVKTMDEVVKSNAVERVDLVKIDVEGAELQVLHGAASMLQRDHPGILMEINPSALAAARVFPHEVLGYVRSLGYTVNEILPSGEYRRALAGLDVQLPNVFCCHPSRG